MVMGQNHHRYCNQKQIQINQLQTQIQQINNTTSSAIAQRDNQIRQANQQHAQAIAQRDEQIKQLTQQLAATTSEKNQQITELTKQKQQKEQENTQLTTKNQQLNERNQDLLEQIENLKYKLRTQNNDNDSKDINAGLVAYFPFNNANALDATGHKNNGTVHGANPTEDRLGHEDNAFYFDGKAYIQGNANNFPKSERTISIWFKPNNLKDSTQALFSYGGNPKQDGTSWQINICNHDGASYCEIQTSINTNKAAFQGPARLHSPTSQDPWNHFVVTTSYNNGTCLYLNGDLINTTNRVYVSDTFVYGREFYIGKSLAPQNAQANVKYATNFEGVIDDLRLYDRELSKEEVNQLNKMPKVDLKNQSNLNNPLVFFQGVNTQQSVASIIDQSLKAAKTSGL